MKIELTYEQEEQLVFDVIEKCLKELKHEYKNNKKEVWYCAKSSKRDIKAFKRVLNYYGVY